MIAFQAKVLTNSCDDTLGRVKLSALEVWDETPLVPCVGGLWFKEGDYVYVLTDDDYMSPLIIGRCMNKSVSYKKGENGCLLFENVGKRGWSICYCDGDKLTLYNSGGFEVAINGGSISVKGDNFDIDNSTTLTHNGTMSELKSLVISGLCVKINNAEIPVILSETATASGGFVIGQASYKITK